MKRAISEAIGTGKVATPDQAEETQVWAWRFLLSAPVSLVKLIPVVRAAAGPLQNLSGPAGQHSRLPEGLSFRMIGVVPGLVDSVQGARLQGAQGNPYIVGFLQRSCKQIRMCRVLWISMLC